MTKTREEPPLRSPIPFRTGSNGEFMPRPPSEQDHRAEERYRRVVDDNARKLGISRRQFIESSCGTAAALLVINQVYGCGDNYNIDPNAAIDADTACHALAGDQFIFDVQTHHVDPSGPWRHGSWELAFDTFPQAGCGETDKMVCYDREHYIREMFINSDTDIAVLSAVPAQDSLQPLTRQETADTRNIIDALQGSPRLLIHGLVLPQNGQAELDGMQNLKETLGISAWKSYTQFGGWRFTDPAGIAFVEQALALDTDIICADHAAGEARARRRHRPDAGGGAECLGARLRPRVRERRRHRPRREDVPDDAIRRLSLRIRARQRGRAVRPDLQGRRRHPDQDDPRQRHRAGIESLRRDRQHLAQRDDVADASAARARQAAQRARARTDPVGHRFRLVRNPATAHRRIPRLSDT